MIVGDIKPLEEILSSVAGYGRILVAGCGSCVSVSLSGGDREARQLARELAQTRHHPGEPPAIASATIERQCEKDFLSAFFSVPEGTEAVLSLACGAGVQTMATLFEPLPVIPALNTTFLGACNAPGVWEEMCRGCGACVLAYTGGICPVARCAKSLFNGPCGGTRNGSCEVDAETPCAWSMIYYRLKKQRRLELMNALHPSGDWRPAGGSGPRARQRTGIGGSPGG